MGDCQRCESAGSVEFGICQVCLAAVPTQQVTAPVRRAWSAAPKVATWHRPGPIRETAVKRPATRVTPA